MKKILAPILILMFFIVSCSSSKKAENDDNAVLPDEDEINDEDAVELDEYEEADDNEENDEDENEIDDGNPCTLIENSNGKYTGVSNEKFKCGCNEGYLWYESDCEKVVTQSFCATLAQVLGFEGTLAELVEAVCHCFSADQCVIEVEIEVEL